MLTSFVHSFPFDPSYGYDEAGLLAVPAPEGPADFADFWQQTYAEARKIPLRVEKRPIPCPQQPAFEVYEIEFDTLGGFRTGGWLSVPRQGPAEFAVVEGHGYGGRAEPACIPGAVTLSPCARGFNRSARPDLPGESMRHVVHGITSRETYIIRGCVAELWGAASALLELFPDQAERLYYSGTSFGGGLGALALPWEDRFKKGFFAVPTFGNHPLRVQLPCNGSGAAVRARHRKHPEVLEVLAYFDAATAARHIRIPMLVAAALFDPAVPPPGQFAVYNGMPGPKELLVFQTGHYEWPGEAAQIATLEERLARWWRE